MRHPWSLFLLVFLAATPLMARDATPADTAVAAASDRQARASGPRADTTAARRVQPDTTRADTTRADTTRADTTRADTTHSTPARAHADTTRSTGLGVRVFGRGELGGAWTRHQPCDPARRLNCNPTAFPLLRPDIEFGVQVAGTLMDRVHIDVDFDQRREFDATNNINVYYQGRPGEVLQRVELGDVSIRLPSSRYLTRGVPAGNFGVKAEARMGPLDLQTVWAQRGGDVTERTFRLEAGREGTVQDVEHVLDDAEYVRGQFFFIVDPAELAGYPHLDVLSLRADAAAPDQRPAVGGSLHLYRDERPSSLNPQQLAQLGYFLAEASSADGTQLHSGRFRRLVPGEDYRVHSSGLWIVLRTPLRDEEALAVAYLTESGEAVGQPDAELAPTGGVPALRLLRGPATSHRPDAPTWRNEMRQIYRLDGSSSVEPGSVELTISLGQASAGATHTAHGGGSISYLRLFGMDEEAPAERLDDSRIFKPSELETAWTGGGAFAGSFIVFPTLRPFAEPGPVRASGLSADEAAELLGTAANPAIYDHPDPLERRGASRFRLNFAFRVRSDGLISSFDLGAFGIRDGSERITVDGRPLRRGVDYSIDYTLGLVTLADPQALFAHGSSPEIEATWEQHALFDRAPASIFGMNARMEMGAMGGLDFVAIYQADRSLEARPHLGLEPSALMLGGVSGGFELATPWLDRWLERLPGARSAPPILAVVAAGEDAEDEARSGTPPDALPGNEPDVAPGHPPGATEPSEPRSRLTIGGELAVSVPDPNRRGATYVDDFEATDAFSIGLDRALWRLGSRPDDRAAGENVLPDVLDVATAASLVWQHDFRDGAGRTAGPLVPRAIDRQISIAGTERTEPVLYLTFGSGQEPAGVRRWRSITTVLETNGRDLSRSEYLEFYAAAPEGRDLALVLDLGEVGEDAFYFDEEGRTSGVYPDGRPWGLGVLDEEARIGDREIWSAAHDSIGLWNQPCLASPEERAYSLGDPRANCTRGNGRVDTEDLNGNGRLDPDDRALFRFVVPLGAASPYRVRDPAATGTEFALYRIPLRDVGAAALGGANTESWRAIRHLRLTIAGDASGPSGALLKLARMRVVGSRWAKRDTHGIGRGPAGDEPGLGAGLTTFRVGPVSRLTDGAAYASPPGVDARPQDPGSTFAPTGVEYNETSLRLAYEALQPGDRAEAYYRFPQRPRDFLNYRELRLWAMPVAGRWGAGGDERLVVSVGTDARNRYLFITPLRAATGAARSPEDWLPEVVIDFERWFELKAEAERLLLTGTTVPGEPVVVWSADSAYAVVLEDRARAPNLAAVREIAFAIHNSGVSPAEGEIWIDDLRLGRGVRDPGMAGHIELGFDAGPLGFLDLSYANRGAGFRQESREIDFRASNDVSVGGTLQLGALAPAGWGLDAPLAVRYGRTGVDPVFLEESDVRADQLSGLRESGARQMRLALTLRRNAPSTNGWLAAIVDPLALRVGYRSAETRAARSRDASRALEAGLLYDARPTVRDVSITPRALDDLLRAIAPDAVRRSDLFRRIVDARLRWTPAAVRVGANYDRRTDRGYRYASIMVRPEDDDVRPIESPRRGLEGSARLELRPFESLGAGVDVTARRDLLDTDRAATDAEARRAIRDARAEIGGLDLGWETARNVDTRLDFRPTVTAWLRPSVTFTGRFRTDRTPSFWEIDASRPDSLVVLRRAVRGERHLVRSVLLDPVGLSAALGGGPGDARSRAIARIGRTLAPLELTWSDAVGSRFDWEAVEPGLGFQLGLGGADRFREIDGRDAASASTRNAFRARGGLRLPARVTLEAAYEASDADVHERLAGSRSIEERAWPDLRLAWTDPPLPRVLRDALVHSAISLGLREHERVHRYLADPGRPRRERRRSAPIHLTVGLANGLSASYTGTFTRGAGEDPTGATREREDRHDARLSGSFIAPPTLRASIPEPVHASLVLSERAHRQCRRTDGPEGCTPFVDGVQRQVALTLDTYLAPLRIGFQLSYQDRRGFVGVHTNDSSFQMGLFGEFDLTAGHFPLGRR